MSCIEKQGRDGGGGGGRVGGGREGRGGARGGGRLQNLFLSREVARIHRLEG